jgi:hypothetical protein
MGIPAKTKPLARPIQNMGMWSTTPTLTIADPIQKANALRRSVNENVPLLMMHELVPAAPD